jgi:CheY-like chemotaxis protein
MNAELSHQHCRQTADRALGNPAQSEQRHALLLEDDDQAAEIIQQYLGSQGYQVTRLANGAAGLRALLGGDSDLILCDMVMPNISGELLYLAVQKTRPHLCERFVFMSGYRANPKIEAFVQSVQGLILWKPFEQDDLREAIARVLMKRHHAGGVVPVS